MDNIVTEMPIGYRFAPTDKELIEHYLMKKVFGRPLPAGQVIQDIDANELYSKPPKSPVPNQCEEREWYFFIHQDENFHSEMKKIRIVENGIGFWKSVGGEEKIYNSDGDVFAFKKCFTYFSGPLRKAKKTQWRMEEYRLPLEYNNNDLKINEWVLGKLKRGRDYNS